MSWPSMKHIRHGTNLRRFLQFQIFLKSFFTSFCRHLRKCKKIGEGVFGEVFLHGSTVLKIIPIAGDIEINGALQKRFDEILQEVIISQELSALRMNDHNFTAAFVEVVNVRLVKGKYPVHLLKLWDEYDSRKESENERPDMFGNDQLYIVFELMNGGCDLEAHEFKNAEQSFSVFKQVNRETIYVSISVGDISAFIGKKILMRNFLCSQIGGNLVGNSRVSVSI